MTGTTRLVRLAAVPLVLVAAVVLTGCVPLDPAGPDQQNQNRPERRDQGPVDSPVVGEWHTSSIMADYMYDRQSDTTYGGGGTGHGYCFRTDGTFTSYTITTGYGPGTLAGWAIGNGRYQADGNQITFYDVYESWTDTKNPDRSHGPQLQPEKMPCTFTIFDDGRMEFSCPYATDDGGTSAFVYTYERSTDETNFEGMRE